MEHETIEKLIKLREAVEEESKDYINTRVVAQIKDKQDHEYKFDMKDLFLLGAITNSDCLITGKTGAGKTHLAKMVMAALFGKEWYNKTVTPNMNKSDFMDIDMPAIKAGTKTIKQAVQGLPLLYNPGIILNEANRAPDLVQAILIPFFDKEFEIEGKEVDLGVNNQGQQYQFKVLTINEGGDYAVQAMGKAIRDRAVIEIPVDMFKQTKEDAKKMLKVRKNSALAVNKDQEHLKEVLEVNTAVQEIELSALAEEYITYLSGMSNCVKSITGSKEGIEFTPEICKGCHQAALDDQICGNVYSPSERSLINLQKVAKGFAMMRAAKENNPEYTENLKVEVEDVIAATPFVLYSKIQLNPEWVKKRFQGSKWKAIEFVAKKAHERLINFYTENQNIFQGFVEGEQLQQEQYNQLEEYVKEKDAWSYQLEDLKELKPKFEPKE